MQEYILKKTIESPGCVIRVYSPVLTEEERAKRMKRIHDAAEKLLKGVIRNEQNIQHNSAF